MSNGFISLFFGAGVAAWAYTKLARQSGNANPGNTMIAAGFIGFLAAAVIFTLVTFVLHF